MSACTNNLLYGRKLSIGQRSKSCEDIPSGTIFQPFDTIESHILANRLTTSLSSQSGLSSQSSQTSLNSLTGLKEEKLDENYTQSDCDSGQFTSSLSLSSGLSMYGSRISLNKYGSTPSLYEYEPVPSFSQNKSGLILPKNVSATSLYEFASALHLSDDEAESSLCATPPTYNQDTEALSSFENEPAPSPCKAEYSSGSSSYESVLSSAEDDVTKYMNDFVIVHTDDDLEKATECKEEIIEDLKEEGATVHIFSEIGLGKTTFQSVQSLHDIYRYILVYVGESLVHDKQYKFIIEMLITAGLTGKENKDYRVVPIFTKKGSSGNLELDTITGIKYFQRNICKRRHIGVLQYLLKLARDRFPS